MRKAKVVWENKVKEQNPKVAIKPHAGMPKHAQEAIKSEKRGSNQKPFKQTGCRKRKMFDAGNQASNTESLKTCKKHACIFDKKGI